MSTGLKLLSGPSKTEMREFTLQQLNKHAQRHDEFAWYPAVGWIGDDGRPFGLALELFGPEPSRKQLENLSSALFRLGAGDEARIEVALFTKVDGQTKIPSRPVRGPEDQTVYSLAFNSSGGLNPSNYMYCVRIRAAS